MTERVTMTKVEESSRQETGRHRSHQMIAFLSALVFYIVWTVGVATGWTEDVIDPWFGTAPPMTPRSIPGQAAEAFALITHPLVILVVTVGLAWRSLQQRQRRLALALAIAALGFPLWELQRQLVQRPRPETEFVDSVSAGGFGYPSGHMMGATILVWVFVVLSNAERKSARSQWNRRILGFFLIGCAGADQWAMGTQYGSDLIGGLLLGITVASGALWISGVDSITRAWALRALPPELGRRAAVIYNPTKVIDLDLFRRRVAYAMARAGWEPPIWIETQREDSGRSMAHDALAKSVDLVLVAGGDGTVRTVSAELAGSGVPMAIIPAGTGNLLGRNLRIPLDEDEALNIALHGEATAIDIVRWTIDGTATPFVVMAGVGIDAQIMRHTSPTLKRLVKGGAYVFAGILQAKMATFNANVVLDGKLVHNGDAVLTLIGNVGRLQGGIALIPSAKAGDGLLHLLVASRGGIRGLTRMLVSLIHESPESPLKRMSGRRIEVTLDRPVAYQLDGDNQGETISFSAEIEASALQVMAPR